jgi:hypothetical protein
VIIEFGAAAAIKRAIELFPTLTDEGLAEWYERGMTPAERKEQFRQSREAMFHPGSIESFINAVGWLSRQGKRKTFNRHGTSYGLKHVASEEIAYQLKANGRDGDGYMTNGIFIAAAIATGFDIKQIDDGPNAWLNIATSAWSDHHEPNRWPRSKYLTQKEVSPMVRRLSERAA